MNKQKTPPNWNKTGRKRNGITCRKEEIKAKYLEGRLHSENKRKPGNSFKIGWRKGGEKWREITEKRRKGLEQGTVEQKCQDAENEMEDKKTLKAYGAAKVNYFGLD